VAAGSVFALAQHQTAHNIAAWLAGGFLPTSTRWPRHARCGDGGRSLALEAYHREKVNGQDVELAMEGPFFHERQERDGMARLPWPRNQSEVMVDAMSVIRFYWERRSRRGDDVPLKHDVHSYWPGRVYFACQKLAKAYGKDCPPSPWKPIVAVYDIPDPKRTMSGLQVRRWKSLYKQGPRDANGMTLAWAQTYVDQSARERYRCDLEILYML